MRRHGFQLFGQGRHLGIRPRVQNNGVGPAIVRSVRVGFDAKPVAHWSELFPRLIAHGSVDAVLTGLKGVVIPLGTNRDTNIVAVRVRQSDPTRVLYDARMRLAIGICCCSIYDDCWIARWMMPRPEQVAACRESDSEFDLC